MKATKSERWTYVGLLFVGIGVLVYARLVDGLIPGSYVIGLTSTSLAVGALWVLWGERR